MRNVYTAEQVVNYVASIDFLNQKNGLITDAKESKMFKNIVKGLNKSDTALIADEYMKQTNKLSDVVTNSLSTIAVFQPEQGMDFNRKYDKSQLKPEKYELVYVEKYPKSSDMPNNDQIVKRFRNSDKLDNYFGHPFRLGDIVVKYNQEDKKAEAFFYNGKLLSKMDGFLNTNMINKTLTNHHIEAEEFLYRAVSHQESKEKITILPKNLRERHSKIKEEYRESFIINKLMSKEIREFDYEKCFSLSYRKIIDYNHYRSDRDINNFQDSVLTKKVFPIDAIDPEKNVGKPTTRNQWKKALEAIKKEKKTQDNKMERNKVNPIKDR